MAEERLQKILSRAGIASRRAAEQLIKDGKVTVNGKVVSELGARADTDRDRVAVEGKPIGREQHVYFLLHKPRGMVTTLSDPEGRPALSELLTNIPERVYPVGRLDFHTSGALLLTNDGDLAQALLHPSREVPKTYIAKLNQPAEDRMIAALRDGVTLDDGYHTQGASVIPLREEEGKGWLEITITEGKNRQIHRMIEAVGARVMRLSRVSFAGLSTDNLRPGQLRPLERQELASLQRRYLGKEQPVPAPRRDEDDYDRLQPRPKPSVVDNPRERREARPKDGARPSAATSRRGAREAARPEREAARPAPRGNAVRPTRNAETARSQERKTRDTFDRGPTSRHKKGPT